MKYKLFSLSLCFISFLVEYSYAQYDYNTPTDYDYLTTEYQDYGQSENTGAVDPGLTESTDDYNYEVLTQKPVVVNPPTRPPISNQVPRTIINWYIIAPSSIRRVPARRQIYSGYQIPWNLIYNTNRHDSRYVARRYQSASRYEASSRRLIEGIFGYYWRI
ncbi:uncharacterized protein LOC131679501 [Topomyia yanbarensis]|uniref:uncharacterized protein LOC131679501 n=1 Tax=Topomyia yanbarensis TaxID=2498891 RepID=UPI00273BE90D|nr:uncharacterized protein LOC131679501 [Topomyia yanbarensis]